MKNKILLVLLMVFTIGVITDVSAAEPVTTDATNMFKLNQKKMNFRDVTANVTDLEGLKKDKQVDTVNFEAKLKNKGKTFRTYQSRKVKIKDISTASKSINLTVPHYGQWEITPILYKGNKKVKTLPVDKGVNVVAEEYNIAPIPATTPVLIFSLNIWEINKNTKGEPIPTIIYLNRPDHYNWNKLPENTSKLPFLTEKQGEDPSSASWTAAKDAMKDYVASLNKLSGGTAKFNLYVNDYHMDPVSPILFENNIPEENYTIKTITDGTASYSEFKKAYNVENATEKHTKIVEKYKAFRKEARETGKSNYAKHGIETRLREMPYVMADVERDAEWSIIQKHKETLTIKDEAFLDTVLANPKVKGVTLSNANNRSGLLEKMVDNGHEKEFRALFNFDDSRFKKSRSDGKKIMMILGTSKTFEDKDPVFPYAEFLMSNYGDEYDYYYKSHPRYITKLDSKRLKQIESAGMQDLDSSIPAELYAFFNPDINLSGYPSSTFQNIGTNESNIALFSNTRDTAKVNHVAYADKMDFFISKNLFDNSGNKFPMLKKDDHLVQFQDENDKEVAILNAKKGELKYYKLDSNNKYISDKTVRRTATTTTTINYNSAGKIVGKTVLTRKNNSTVQKAYYTYNAKNQLTTVKYHKPKGKNFVFTGQDTYVYYSNGKVNTKSSYTKNTNNVYTSTSTLKNSTNGVRYSYTKHSFHSNGKVNQRYYYRYNKKGDLKTNKYGVAYRTINTRYTNSKLRRTEGYRYNANGNGAIYRTRLNYTNKGVRHSYVKINYRANRKAQSRVEYRYNNKGQLKTNRKHKAYRYTTSYNKKGKATSSIRRQYNSKGKFAGKSVKVKIRTAI